MTAYDSPIYIADAAVYLMATQPDLGITNPYALDQTQFDAAIALLEQQKPLVGRVLVGLPASRGQALASGTRHAAPRGRSSPTTTNATTPDAVSTVKPKEGTTGWSDTWMVTKDTENINCSYLWLDYIASPEANAQIAEYFGEAPANAKACALTTNADHCADFHAERGPVLGRRLVLDDTDRRSASTVGPTSRA